jgi:ABC-type uncharacterized transport system substrate-binding protein
MVGKLAFRYLGRRAAMATMSARVWRGSWVAVPAMLMFASAGPATAHPHNWINVEATIFAEGEAFKGIRYAWRFSRDYADGLLQEYDTNRDGVLSSEELQSWLELSKKNLDTFKFFTIARLGRDTIAISTATDFSLDRPNDGGLQLHFTVHFVKPVAVTSAAPLQIDVYDPTFFTEFVLGDGANVKVEAAIAGQCQASVALAPGGSQQKAITSFMKLLGRNEAKLSPAKVITVTCKG